MGGPLDITPLSNKTVDEIQCDKCTFDTQEENNPHFTH